MSRSRRVCVWPTAAGMAAALLVVLYDASQTIRWGGSKNMAVFVEAPHPARSVLYICGGESFAIHYRAESPEHWEAMMRGDGRPELARCDPGGSFVLPVKTFGTESGLRLLHNRSGQMTHAILVVELETSERWVAILTLPDVTRSSSVTLRIPENAYYVGVEVAPAPRPSVVN